MKRIFFGKNGRVNGHIPFWQPWGCFGCLWRVLLFVLMLLLLLFLMNLLQQCDRGFTEGPSSGVELPEELKQNKERIYEPENPSEDEGVENPDQDNRPVSETDPVAPRPIDDPNLPSDEDNRMPPISDDEIITDPGDGKRKVVQGLLNVILDSDANDETFKSFASQFKQHYPGDEYEIVHYNTFTKTLQIRVPEDKRAEVRENLPRQITNISFRVIDEEVMNTPKVPNDVGFKYPQKLWYFEPIQMFDAWDITEGSENVTVAIVDSYFDLNHEELKGNRIVKPYSVERRSENVAPARGIKMEVAGHGSLVASVAVGNANNKEGSSGIAPKCKYMPISVGGTITTMREIEGILYAIYQGADVVNLSLGMMFADVVAQMPVEDQIEGSKILFKHSQETWDFIFDLAEKRNVTIVWSAGNQSIYSALDATKRNPHTIRVAALNQKLEKADFSNFGNIEEYGVEESTISAPGVAIYGALPNNTYDCWDGTSFSAPIITGTVALMKSLNKSLTNQEIITILQETGVPVRGRAGKTVGKMVQVRDALKRVQDSFMNYDEVMGDHSKILGWWESADLLTATDINTGQFRDKVRLYMNFTSLSEGAIVFKESSSGKKYTAPLKLSFNSDAINVEQTASAVSEGEQKSYVIHIYEGRPDNNRYALFGRVNEPSETFYLRKVKGNI